MTAPPDLGEHAEAIARLYSANPMIRVVNYHNTPRVRADQLREELAHYGQLFSSVNEDELAEYMTTGRWVKSKPGLIVAVYEGFRNGYDVLAPLLEEHGLTGWFFIITKFLNCPVDDQLTFTEGHRIRMQTREYSDGRYALTWNELRELDRKHVIASHTRSHPELSILDLETLEREVVGAQEDLQEQLGHRVRTFSSRTGPAYGEYPDIDRFVASAGYEFVFSNFRVQRVRAPGSR